MPHQCTNCGRGFPDGSKEMLSGCPDCGGNKFQFSPAGTESDDGPATESGSTDRSDGDVATASEPDQSGAVSRAASTVRTWLSDDDGPTDGAARGSTSTAAADRASTPGRRTAADSATDPAKSGGSNGNGLTDDFPEWPDTARPPADRSDEPGGSEPTAEARTGDSSAGETADSSSDRTVDSPSGKTADSSPDKTADSSPDKIADRSAGESPSGRDREVDEDSAQASARSDVVSSADLPPPSERSSPPSTSGTPAASDPAPKNGRVVSEPSAESPSLEELRQELDDQFESIKIIRPGQYELNLMELYDREEYIVSLQEDGRYVIDVPDSWRDGDDGTE